MTSTEIIEGQVVREHLETALAVRQENDLALAVDVDAVLDQWRAYQRLTRELLDDTDFQQIGKARFKKKSAWRKYARAFNIVDEVTFEQIERDDKGRPIFARIRVKATLPNGRSSEADQEAHLGERCCPTADGDTCGNRSQYHTHCVRDCSARFHWSHPGDLPATALTRAKNRAIADLIGAGEVSAEEMAATPREPEARPAPKAFLNRDLSALMEKYNVGLRDIAQALEVPPEPRAGVLDAIAKDLEAHAGASLEDFVRWVKGDAAAETAAAE